MPVKSDFPISSLDASALIETPINAQNGSSPQTQSFDLLDELLGLLGSNSRPKVSS